MKKPESILGMALVLSITCLIMGAALALVNDLTFETISQQQVKKKLLMIKSVLPQYDNDPVKDAVTVADQQGNNFEIDRGYKAGLLVGVALEVSDPQGYAGEIKIIMGLLPDGRISGIEILDMKETPGLGLKIADKEWRAQFMDKDLRSTRWLVKKDGGDIQAITGATISPRAVTRAVKKGLDLFEAQKNVILK